jgi:hypothetical protein
MNKTNLATKRVILIDTDGSITSLYDRKKKLDLSKFGNQKIERASDILWDEDNQKFKIKMLAGALQGEYLCDAENNILYFNDYDLAVSYEIDFINSRFLTNSNI